MSLFWKEYKEYIITISIAISGIVLVWFGVIPLQQKITEQLTTSQELLTDRSIRDARVADLYDLRKKKTLVTQKEDQLNVIIPRSHIVDLVKEIEALAQTTHTDIIIDAKDQPVTPATKKPAAANPATDNTEVAPIADEAKRPKTLIETFPNIPKISISITLTGRYDDITNFVQKFESMHYKTDIVGIALSVQQPDSQSNQAGVNIFSSNQSTPSIPDSTTIAKVNAPLGLKAVLDTIVYVSED